MTKNGKIINCILCAKSFYKNLSQIGGGEGKFCSKVCYWISMRNIPPPHIDNHGKSSWNKGLIGYKSGEDHWTFGKKLLDRTGENHWFWKGDEVGRSALHRWVERGLGKPRFCEGCGTEETKRYYWANKTYKYKRDLDDWLRLCARCHGKYDNIGEKAWATRRRLYG
mgnify:CR=1 FL=1